MKGSEKELTFRKMIDVDKYVDTVVRIGVSEKGVLATGFHNENLQAVISECLRMARERFPGMFFEVEAREWDMNYGDIQPDGCVFVRPFSGRPAKEASDIEAGKTYEITPKKVYWTVDAAKVAETEARVLELMFPDTKTWVEDAHKFANAPIANSNPSRAEVPTVTVSPYSGWLAASLKEPDWVQKTREQYAELVLQPLVDEYCAMLSGSGGEPVPEESPDILAVTRRMFR